MVNTVHTQPLQNVFDRQSYAANGQHPLRGVRQDKGASKRDRIASLQPAPHKKVMRAHHMNRYTSRSQNRPTPKRKTVHLTLWVKPVVKAELQRIAASEGLSISATGGAFLEQALQEHVDMHYSALLQPIIEQAIRTQMRSYSTRLAMLLVPSSFASEQTRSLATNILSRQPGVTPKELTDILNGSSNAAKRNITRSTPQLAELLAETERWIAEVEGERHA